MDFVKLVEELNEDFYENNPNLIENYGICYSYLTDGFVDIVKFMDICVYHSDDGIEYDNNDNVIPIIASYIKQKTKNILGLIKL